MISERVDVPGLQGRPARALTVEVLDIVKGRFSLEVEPAAVLECLGDLLERQKGRLQVVIDPSKGNMIKLAQIELVQFVDTCANVFDTRLEDLPRDGKADPGGVLDV